MNTVRIAEREVVLPAGVAREDCIRLLAREAAALWYPGQEEVLAASALERETEESTYLGRGLAVPHARVPGLPYAAVYVVRGNAIAWPSEPADCVVLLCVPAEQPELHLQLLGKVVRWRTKGGALEILMKDVT